MCFRRLQNLKKNSNLYSNQEAQETSNRQIEEELRRKIIDQFDILKEVADCENPKFIEIIKDIISFSKRFINYTLDLKDKISGNTILHYWTLNKLHNSAKVFVKYITNIDETNNQGYTSVEIAWMSENVKMLQLLYKHGWEIVSENDDKLSLLWLSLCFKSIYWAL